VVWIADCDAALHWQAESSMLQCVPAVMAELRQELCGVVSSGDGDEIGGMEWRKVRHTAQLGRPGKSIPLTRAAYARRRRVTSG
jgi:hypothetical protein